MKVLMVHSQMALYGGAEIVIVRLAKYLQTKGHVVAIVTLSTANHSEYNDLDIRVPDKQIQYRLRGSLSALSQIRKMYWELKSLCNKYAQDFDVINIHNFPAIWTTPKKPVVWMCNEIPDLYHNQNIPSWFNPLLNSGRWLDRMIVRSKHSVAVVADSRMAILFKHRYQFEPIVIPYGIDIFEVDNSNLDSKTFKIICPSMISPSKNQLEVLQAIAGMKNVQLILAGYYEENHPYTKLLRKFIAENNLDVIWTGMLSRLELIRTCTNVGVAVFMGRGQGSWLGPFEQLSIGIPVIVSPNLTCSSLIKEAELGTVTNNLTETLLRMQLNYKSYKSQALRSQQWVKQNLTWNNFCQRFEELLCQVK